MDFTLERNTDWDTGDEVVTFHGRFIDKEISTLLFDPIDQMLLDGIRIDRQEPITASEMLLALEVIYRRYEEQSK